MTPRLLIRNLAALAAVLVWSGCASNDWRGYGYDTTHFARQPNESVLTASSVSTLHQNFDFSTSGNSFTSSPSVYNNLVYIGGLNGIFYAIRGTGASKGTPAWTYPPAIVPAGDPCGTTTTPLLIASGSGNPSGPGIASSASIVDNVAGHTAVIFGAPDPTSHGGDGRLWALDATTGNCIWKSDVLAPTSGTSKVGYSSPAIAHGRAYIGVAAKQPDSPIPIGKIFSVMLDTGHLDPAFNFAASGPPKGGGVWSSPAITPSGNVVITTGNSCFNSSGGSPDCNAAIPATDYTMSMLKLNWQTGQVLWQLQPVDIHHDHDPDYAASPIAGQVSCGSLAISVQKDGYVHAVDIKTGGPFSNPACSYTGHSLECPRWSFPTAPSLPFEDDSHGDTDFIHPGALDGDHLFTMAGGMNLSALGDGAHHLERLYSLNVCSNDADRVRWIFPVAAESVGSPSVAHGLIYVGDHSVFDTSASPHTFYVLADTDVVPPSTPICSYPEIPAGPTCFAGGFKNVWVPSVLKQFTLAGSMPGHPAISNGQVYVATTGGHVYGFIP